MTVPTVYTEKKHFFFSFELALRLLFFFFMEQENFILHRLKLRVYINSNTTWRSREEGRGR